MENNERRESMLPSPEAVAQETAVSIAEFGKTAVKVAVEAMTEPLQIVDSKPQTHPSAERDELARIRAALLAVQEENDQYQPQQRRVEAPTPMPVPETPPVEA